MCDISYFSPGISPSNVVCYGPTSRVQNHQKGKEKGGKGRGGKKRGGKGRGGQGRGGKGRGGRDNQGTGKGNMRHKGILFCIFVFYSLTFHNSGGNKLGERQRAK